MDGDPASFTFILYIWAFNPAEIGLNLFLLLILLWLSATISAAEMAYFSLQPNDILQLQKNDNAQAKRVLGLLERSQYLLSTFVVANTFVNVATVLILGLLLDFWDGTARYLLQFATAWFLIITIGEIAPKLYGSQQPLSVALRFSRALVWLKNFFAPANFILVNFTKIIEKRVKSRLAHNQHDEISQQDIEQVIDITMNQTKYAKRDVKMLKSLVKFANKMVRSAMRARMEIVAVEKNDDFEQIIQVFKTSAYSRIPVYEEDLDKVVGVLHFKDIIFYLHQPQQWDINELLREAYFVPENKKLDDLLSDFQKEKQHLAIVVDEFGQTTGLITLEDVLENIVGDIEDEFDEPEIELFQIIDEKNFILQPFIPLDTFFEICRLDPARFESLKQDSETLSGLLMILSQQMPAKGEIIRYEELEFCILEANERKIDRVRLSILTQNELQNQENEIE